MESFRKKAHHTLYLINIFFTFPESEQMKVDMRYLYGRDVGQVLNLYDYNVDQYYANSRVVIKHNIWSR